MVAKHTIPQAGSKQLKKSNQSELDRLANLSRAEYESERREAAKRLGWRPSVLDEEVARSREELGITQRDQSSKSATHHEKDLFPMEEPWPDPVDLVDLLDELANSFRRYVVLPPFGAETAALWVLLTYLHDRVCCSPILAVVSPQPRCGKTTFLSILSAVVYRALPTSNITGPVVFRAIDKWQPTLLIDEADTFLLGNYHLHGVINSGHTKNTAFVLRCEGEDFTPRHFSTWCPKAIALIGKLPPTLADRAITISLRRRLPDESVDKLPINPETIFAPLRQKILRWVQDDSHLMSEMHDWDGPKGLNDRAADNWATLVSIGFLARTAKTINTDRDWYAHAQAAALALSANCEGAEADAAAILLTDLRDLFEQQQVDRITSAELLEHLTGMLHRPWSEWRRGFPITAQGIAKLLDPFAIRPRTIRTKSGTAKGYLLEQFEDAFRRYL